MSNDNDAFTEVTTVKKMRIRIKVIILIYVFLFNVIVVGNSFAGPFGSTMGESADEYKKDISKIDNYSFFVTPKEKHPLFELYEYRIHQKTGLSFICAISDVIRNDNYGEKTREIFNNIKLELSEKYGNGEAVDNLKNGSIWNEKQEWAMGVYEKDRTYKCVWKPQNVDNIKLVVLNVIAASKHDLNLILTFSYDNYDEYEKLVKEETKGSI